VLPKPHKGLFQFLSLRRPCKSFFGEKLTMVVLIRQKTTRKEDEKKEAAWTLPKFHSIDAVMCKVLNKG